MIDTIGGDSGRLYSWMPERSEIILLGNLSNEDVKFNTTEFFMHEKKICGFNLDIYMREKLDENKRKDFMKFIQDDINSGGKYFNVNIA